MKQEIVFSKDNYYEAVIQLRPETDAIMQFLHKQIEKAGVKIQKIVRTDYGTDVYVTSQRFARAFGSKLKRMFKGTLKMSRLLFSKDRQTSKNIYRVTVLFRPEMKPKDLKTEEEF